MQILPEATRSTVECTKLVKVEIFWFNRRSGYFFIPGFQLTSNEIPAYVGWGESIISFRLNLRIIPPDEHNFENNILVWF